MKRDQALDLMDRLLALGYRVRLSAVAPDSHFMRPGYAPGESYFNVEIAELGVDKVDVRALVAVADEMGLDCGFHTLANGFNFSEPDPTPEVVRNPRRHPRG